MNRYFITIKNRHSGERLDKIIPELLPRFSRRQARRLIEAGSVSIDGHRIRTLSRPVQEGETIAIHIDTNTIPDGSRVPEIRILQDDPWFVVIDKPSGVPSDATRSSIRGSVTDILSPRYPGKRLQTVHRLDMGTSGIMVVSKTPAATRSLSMQFQARQIEKGYKALVHGRIDHDGLKLVTLIDRDPSDARKYRSVPSGGKEAVTEFRPVSLHGQFSMLDIVILTGRTHQIRVHMSEIGHPVAGDVLYGFAEDPAPRLMLHAGCLSFRSPRTGDPLQFESELPRSFADYIEAIG